MTVNRRTFFMATATLASGIVLPRLAFGQAALDPNDAQAAALGYVTDATKANKAKYASYAPGQRCGTCQLFGGAAGAATGPCPIFSGKLVTANSWCSAYTKKA